MKKNYIDVGCNRGQYSGNWINFSDAYIYAFEPNPVLYSHLKTFESGRFRVFDYAVGTNEGLNDFHIGENDATSSLKKFDKSVTAFKYIETIKVNVIRLDTFCISEGIENIELLKIDAQGSDLDVLESLGDYIHKVNQIIIEAFINEDVDVYENEVKESQVMNFLIPKGFSLTNRMVDGNYCDLYFTKQ